MPRIRLDPDGTGNSQLGGIDTPLQSNDAANMDYVDTVAAAIALGAVPSGINLPTMNTVAGQAFILLATDGTNTPGYYYRNSANNAWIKDDTEGGGGIRLWQRNTAYTSGEVIYTDDTSSLFNAAVRNKVYRVESDFTSANTFDTTNLAIIGERNTTYAIEASASTTTNSADITLVGSDISEDDVTITGGDNITVTRNSDSQITIAASGVDHIPFYSSTALYEIGDVIAYEQIVDSITAGSPPDDATELLTFIGNSGTAVPEGGRTAEEPFISTNTGIERFSRDWMISASNITPFQDVLQYATGAVVIHGGALFRARQNILRSNNTTPLSPPSDGDNWTNIGIIDAAVTANGGDPQLNVSRQAWDRLNRTVIGYPLMNDGSVDTTGTPGILGTGATRENLPGVIGAASEDNPLALWAADTDYAVGDQVLHDGGSNVNSIYISRAAHTSTAGSPPSTNQAQWHLVRSGLVSVQGPDDANPDPLTGNATLHLREGTGINITRTADTADFTISTNLDEVIPSGTSFPSSPNDGDFFFLQADSGTDLQGLYERVSGAWVAGNTERTDAEIDARVALGRTQRVRLDGTTLRFYYGTDISGNGDFTADVSDLTDFPFFHYTNIANRNAATDHNGRSVFATVSNDTGDGSADPQGVFATYVLVNPPAAGQPTVNANWERITSPDSIINEVCVRVWDEANNDYFPNNRSLGTTSAVEGLTETTANGIYARQDNNLSDLRNAETARSNIGAAALTEVTTVEFPNSDVENRLTNIEFNDAGDQLTFTDSNNATRSFTGGGQPNGGYPTVGGIALENLGTVTHGATDTYSWPTGAAQVFGENADQITYTAGGGSGNQAVNGVLTNNTGSTIELGNGVLDIDITITAITGASLQASFGLILPGGDATTPVINAPYSVVLPITNFNNLPARLTVRVPIQGSATSAWTNGSTIGLVVTENNSAERPFTYDVNAIRLSYTSHDFHKVGAAADIVFQETDGVITNLDSISIDNTNRLVFSGSTGSLIYTGGGGDGDVMSSDVIAAWTSGTSYDEGRLVYTTTSNRYLPWRRNATAYSSDPATAETERTNSPDSTDGASLWDVLPPVVNTTANSPIVVDRNGWNIGTVDHSLRRVSNNGNRLDLAPTGITAATYNNPHITIDQYGRAISANNGTALTDLPHTGYSYSRQDNLSNNLYTNRSQDVYNILGLFLAFNESAVDVAQGTELYIFDNGNADTGSHRLTLRRNAEPETDIFEGHTFGFDVIFGFDWLEQFLGMADPGSSTRDLDLTSDAALSAFSSLYTRNTITRPAVLERLGSGEVRWVYPQDAIDGDAATANNTATKGSINTAITAVNTRIDNLPAAAPSPFDNYTISGTPSTTLAVPKWTANNTLEWSVDNTSSGGGGVDAATISGLSGINWPTDNTPQINSNNIATVNQLSSGDEWPLLGGFAFGGLGQAHLATNTDGWYWPGGSNTSARYNSGANGWTYSTPASTYNDNDDDTTGDLQLAARLSVGGRLTSPADGQVITRFDIDINVTQLPTDGSTSPIIFLDNYDVSDPGDDGNRFAFTDIPINSLGRQTVTLNLTNATVRDADSITLDTGDYVILTFSEGASTESPVTFDVENIRVSSTTTEFTRVSQGSSGDESNTTLIPVYFDLNSSGQAQNLSLRVVSTATHYALVRSDGYGVITVFNSDGTLASNAASSINTLNNNTPPYFEFLPLTVDTYFAPAVDTPEQMHDDLREWVNRDFEVQLNPHPDTGTITGHTFTLGGQTGTISNVSSDGRVFDISLTDAQRGLATTAINPTNNNHIDMVFTWVHSGITHTWTNPINLIEDLGTEQTIGDFLVRRGTQEGIEADTVAGTVTDELYLTGGDIGVFGNINNLGIANGVRYLLTFTNVPAGVTNLSNQVAAGDTYLITTPGGSSFSPAGVVFQNVRRVTNGVEAGTAPNFNLYNRGGNAPSSEHVTFTLSSFSTGNPGLEIVNRENNAIIFRLSPTGDLEIAGSLTQNNVAQ